ncbi:hypothetical protein TNCT_60181 [Trichonephila clavata]|uniref:Uncharacterized protein n=1 Tax=Trichonephila clavata TaxID=2740835 RepID=A0A8X6HQ35_TRICU|nr:hypothetical protein TNCT_60181 [Trichonephila clavata]
MPSNKPSCKKIRYALPPIEVARKMCSCNKSCPNFWTQRMFLRRCAVPCGTSMTGQIPMAEFTSTHTSTQPLDNGS